MHKPRLSNKSYSLFNQDGQVIVENLKLANRFITRFKGLMGTKQLPASSGLLISPCQQVHTHFMRYPLDIIFLDRQMYVIAVVSNLKPWRFTKYYKQAYYVLEIPATLAANKIFLSDQLSVKNNS